jgi:hypothetical protein
MTAETPTPVPVPHETPPDVYTAWCRIDYPRITDGAVTAMWNWKSPAEHEFWRSLAREPKPPPVLAAVMAECEALRERAEAAEAAERQARRELAALESGLARAIADAIVAEREQAEAAKARLLQGTAG